MTRFLTLEEALVIVSEMNLTVRDMGLLDSGVHRPMAAFAGQEAYPTAQLKAAALLHLLARNHPFLDGNKRFAWVASDVFLQLNGLRSRLNQHEMVALVLAVSTGELSDLEKIAAGTRIA